MNSLKNLEIKEKAIELAKKKASKNYDIQSVSEGKDFLNYWFNYYLKKLSKKLK